MATSTPHVVILGAGFAGLYVAHELSRLLPKDACSITLVDQNDFLLFTPLLTEVVGGEVDPRDSVVAVRTLSPRVTYVRGRVEAVDVAAREVTVGVGDMPDAADARRALRADHLVIALGSVTNFHGVSGVEEHALTVKSIDDAAQIRDRALTAIERAAIETDGETRRRLLTFVVAGGGFSGVETMAALNNFVRDAAKRSGQVQVREIRTVLVHDGGRLLPELSADLGSYAQQELEARGVEVRLKTEVKGAGPGWVQPGTGDRVETATFIWTAGVRPSPIVDDMDLRRGRHGGIVVDGCCRVPDHEGIWALGDCGEVPQPGSGTYAPTAQNATREGKQVARNIAAALRGEEPQPFVYRPVGELALVGKRAGVARLYGVNLSGFTAWVLWRGVYLGKMPPWRKRLRVGIDWSLDLMFGRDLVTLRAHSRTAHPRPRVSA